MQTKNIMIKKLIRMPKFSEHDELEFRAGVNVIVGMPNTGKTKWLQMLDYLMGERGKPEDSFGQDLVSKYDSVKGIFQIGDKEVSIERRWKERGMKGKVIINDEAIPVEDFSDYLLKELNIPILHFPQGNPYSERMWPVLGWRSLLRHMYRQRRFWSDIADKQVASEQHACMMLFLGIAEILFSEEYGELVAKRKRIFQLEAGKEQFLAMLDQVSKGLIQEDEIQVGITESSLDAAISKIQIRITAINGQKKDILQSLIDKSFVDDSVSTLRINDLEGQWRKLTEEREEILNRLSATDQRLEELSKYRYSLNSEIDRITRTERAGRILSGLKVTNCPVCDQSIDHLPHEDGSCYLCRQDWIVIGNDESVESRIDFELDQIRGEIEEIDTLIDSINQSRQSDMIRRKLLTDGIHTVESRLKPFRDAFASIFPPELALLDMEIGRLHERINQLERMRLTLDLRTKISQDIDEIQKEINLLDIEVKQKSLNINYSQASDLLVNGMMAYINELTEKSPRYWTQGRIGIRLRERDFMINVSGEKWSQKLGGTLTLYFLLAYHYGLLALFKQPECHYPGLVILDFPATLEDGATIADKENYILEPFVKLVHEPGMEGTQVIAAGAAFENLEGAHRIEFTYVWG